MPRHAATPHPTRSFRNPTAGSLPRPRAPVVAATITLTAIIGFAGCASPPAVGPLLRVVDRALADSHDQLEGDRQRAAQWVDQQRATLTDAFDADLASRDELSVEWVRDHALVFAAAREAIARHEMTLAREYDQRQANLRDARRAHQTAIELIEQHDALFQAVPDARRWLGDPDHTLHKELQP